MWESPAAASTARTRPRVLPALGSPTTQVSTIWIQCTTHERRQYFPGTTPGPRSQYPGNWVGQVNRAVTWVSRLGLGTGGGGRRRRRKARRGCHALPCCPVVRRLSATALPGNQYPEGQHMQHKQPRPACSQPMYLPSPSLLSFSSAKSRREGKAPSSPSFKQQTN